MANACAGANSHARCMCMVCVEVVCVWGARVRGVAVRIRAFCAGCNKHDNVHLRAIH